MKRICVFCGSSNGARPVYVETARKLGTAIAGRGWGVVYGGAKIGLMGSVADAALEAGGEVIGVIPDILMTKERAHAGLTELRVVASMHERKALMAELADGFIALPGGFGTFEELCEIITWNQLGIYRKPVGLLNIAGYYDALLALIDTAIDQQFVRQEHRHLLLPHTEIEPLLDQLSLYTPPLLAKWVDASAS